MDTTLIELQDVDLEHGNQKVLRDISLVVKEKEITTIIGPNGAGKSSLIKIIAGLENTCGGKVARRAGLSIGYVPQKLFLDKSMPIKVSRFLSLAQVPKRNYQRALTRVNADHLASKQIHTLSGGELQRVLLARAISRNPDLLLLDEPLQGVDINGQTELYQLINDIREEDGCAVLMVSHDLHLVMAQTDHVVCLNQHICCQGKPESVSKDPGYLGLFGHSAATKIAVYTHHHDHHHNLHGDIEACGDQCRHD